MALRKLPKGQPPDVRQSLSESRIEEIAATLRNCSFRNGVTLKEFAAKWGITMNVVHLLSAAASKRVRAEMTDPDRVASKAYAMIERIADEAMDAYDPKTGDNVAHRKLALAAADTWLTKCGIAAPTKAQVAVHGDLTALSQEQLEERAAAILERIATELEK